MTETKPHFFIWVDIETTGLDSTKDSILEIAVILTDSNLKEIDSFHRYVSNDLPTNDFVIKMHAKSGLTEALKAVDHFEPSASIDTYLCDFLRSVQSVDGWATYYFAGSSVHFDVSFIENWFPNFAAMCSHRHLDVSSLTLALKIKNPKFKSKVQKFYPEHRAMSDIKSSLAFARKYYGKKRRWAPRVNHGGPM